MSERGVGNPWTTYEDNLLIQAVAVHGENDNWKAVALSVPGRTNKACRKRWLHSLSPNVKKTAWTPEEDQLLLSLYAVHGTKWSVIARNIPGRTDDACSKRYREALDPSLKRDDWTADEDAKLLEAHGRLGGKWGIIGQELSRSGLGCRNRWRMLERKRAAGARGSVAQGESVSTPASTYQWPPANGSLQDTPPWDGRSPQYVTPSMLFNSSPNHPQEPHPSAYRPEQILSGAHLASAGSSPPQSQHFPYGSSSLSGALSHPGSVAHSPNPHAYYPQPAALPQSRDTPSQSDAQVTGPAQSRECTSGDYDMMGLPGGRPTPNPPETVLQEDDHTNPSCNAGITHGRDSLPLHLLDNAGPSIGISDSPASPSPVGSPLPLDSPPGTPRAGGAGPPSVTLPTDSAHAPRSYYRTEAEKAQQTSAPRKGPTSQRPARLSSLLPATSDASVLAYACGHRACWPPDATSSKSAFVTSKELSDHSKLAHNGDLGGTKPFRCGLTGCEKSWKSVNGLQYHLQISKVHFQQALATIRDPSELGNGSTVGASAAAGAEAAGESEVEPTNGAVVTAADAVGSAVGNPVAPAGEPAPKDARPTKPKPKPKFHPCPHPECGKQYRQLSGLRYHLSHGHTEELPMQLDVVPPTLARMVAEKGRVG